MGLVSLVPSGGKEDPIAQCLHNMDHFFKLLVSVVIPSLPLFPPTLGAGYGWDAYHHLSYVVQL